MCILRLKIHKSRREFFLFARYRDSVEFSPWHERKSVRGLLFGYRDDVVEHVDNVTAYHRLADCTADFSVFDKKTVLRDAGKSPFDDG